jgi:large subunit ribosomal protein L30e
MNITKIIKDAIKEDKAILGYNRVIKSIKTQKPKVIIYANNIPKSKLENIIYNTNLAKIETMKYENDGMNLGLVCGKPFSVSVLAIKRE